MNALKVHRKACGLRQIQLAHLAHICQGDIVSFEKGRRLPSVGQAKRIALALGLEVEALFTDGFREHSNKGRPAKSYVPPELPQPVPRYPREFSVECWKCRTRIHLRTDNYQPVLNKELHCPSCGAEIKVADGQVREA